LQRVRTAQEEREFAIRAFKGYKKDVLVASDVASKGLDFPDIQHVINYDMPKEIENYGMHLDDIVSQYSFGDLQFVHVYSQG
jgi:hypothetical protein